MMDEYYSLHDKIRDKALEALGEKQAPIKQIEKEYDLQDVRRALSYILDKLRTIDRYVREDRMRKPVTLDGEYDIIRCYFLRLKNGTASEEDKKLFLELIKIKELK